MNTSMICRLLGADEIANLNISTVNNNKHFYESEKKTFLPLEQIEKTLQNQLVKIDDALKCQVKELGLGPLPYDCLMKIALLLDAKEIFSIVRTCKSLARLSCNPFFLKKLVQLHPPESLETCHGLKLNSWIYHGKPYFTLSRILHRINNIDQLEKNITKTSRVAFFVFGTVLWCHAIFNLLGRK